MIKTADMIEDMETEWETARRRLGAYFRALGFINEARQKELIDCITAGAVTRHAAEPERQPLELVMETARSFFAGWFARRAGRTGVGASNTQSIVSLLVTEALQRWPDAVLAEQVPPEFEAAMQSAQLVATPELRVSCMAPRPFEITPLPDLARLASAWSRLETT